MGARLIQERHPPLPEYSATVPKTTVETKTYTYPGEWLTPDIDRAIKACNGGDKFLAREFVSQDPMLKYSIRPDIVKNSWKLLHRDRGSETAPKTQAAPHEVNPVTFSHRIMPFTQVWATFGASFRPTVPHEWNVTTYEPNPDTQ